MTLEELYNSKKHLMKKWWFWVILILIMTRFCNNTETKTESVASSSPSVNSSESVSPTLPTDEQNFIDIIQSAQSKSSDALNDMQRGGVIAERNKATCKALKKLTIKDWIGTIVTIDATSDGKGIVGIEIAKKINIDTWMSSVYFSDQFGKTLLSPESEIFKAVSGMKVGTSVRFTGEFLRGLEDNECILQTGYILKNKLEEPEFIFKFNKIALSEDTNEQVTNNDTQKNKLEKTGISIKNKKNFSSPPSLILPSITFWEPDLTNGTICNSSNSKCKAVPTDNMFCTTQEKFNAHIEGGQTIINAGKTCKKWGEDRLARQYRGESPVEPPRSIALQEAVRIYLDYQGGLMHVSWLNNKSAVPSSGVICFSKKDKNKEEDFYLRILRSCEEWAE